MLRQERNVCSSEIYGILTKLPFCSHDDVMYHRDDCLWLGLFQQWLRHNLYGSDFNVIDMIYA